MLWFAWLYGLRYSEMPGSHWGVTELGLWDPVLSMVWNCCSAKIMLYFHTSMCAGH